MRDRRGEVWGGKLDALAEAARVDEREKVLREMSIWPAPRAQIAENIRRKAGIRPTPVVTESATTPRAPDPWGWRVDTARKAIERWRT